MKGNRDQHRDMKWLGLGPKRREIDKRELPDLSNQKE
jgi:hypothetical protein